MFSVDYSKVTGRLTALGIAADKAEHLISQAKAAGNPRRLGWSPLIFEARDLLSIRGIGPKGVRRFADFIREGKWGYVLY